MTRYELNREQIGTYLMIAFGLIALLALFGWLAAGGLMDGAAGAAVDSRPSPAEVEARSEAVDAKAERVKDLYRNPELKTLEAYRAAQSAQAESRFLAVNPEVRVFRNYIATKGTEADSQFLATNPEIISFRRYQQDMIQP